jgi:hypothetical protein
MTPTPTRGGKEPARINTPQTPDNHALPGKTSVSESNPEECLTAHIARGLVRQSGLARQLHPAICHYSILSKSGAVLIPGALHKVEIRLRVS